MPIPPADYAVPSSTGNGTLANHGSQKRQRKRNRAGYQVGQTTSVSNILTKHQQPPEQLLVPPIKLRRVDDGRRMVFEEPAQEPMETEPAIMARTESLPVAVFGAPSENPQPTSGNILSTTSETTRTPVRENIEPMEDDNPADTPPAQIPSEVLSKFLPEHQEALREHLINENLEIRQDLKERLKTVVQNAEKLLEMLRERKIELSKNRSRPPFPTLFARLKEYSIVEKPELFSTYFAKVSVFFLAVNTNQIKNTGCLSSMLVHKSQIKGFTEQSEEVIRFIASQPFLKQISSMHNGRGFPPRERVATFLSIPCLKQGWQPGCDEAVQGEQIDQELLIHISSMHNGRGFPGREQVAAFMTMSCLKEGWQQGRDEAVRDQPMDRELLMRIASMMHNKGFPTKGQVEAFMTMPCLKEGWQPGRDEAVKDNPLDRKLLIRVASMNSCNGFPTREQLEVFMTMPCLKEGWQQGNNEVVQDSPIDRDLLMRIASMSDGKGFPTSGQVAAFMTIPCLGRGWQQGHDEVVRSQPIDRDLLVRIASMHNRKGFPKSGQVEAFMTMPCLKQDWQQGNDGAVQDKPIDRDLLVRIASMMHGKGFPAKQQVEDFMTMPYLKEGWQQGNDEAVQGKPIDRELLLRVASINSGKGFPAKAQVAAFIAMPCLKEGWQQGCGEAVQDKPIDRDLLMRIASMMHGRGFPAKGQVEDLLTMPCLEQGWQQGNDEAVQGKSIDRELLVHIASMNNGKGFPTRKQVAAFMIMPCLKEGWQPGGDEAVRSQPIDRNLLVRITSMNDGKGFPTKEQVAAFLAMPCLREGWQPGRDEAVQDKPIDRGLLMRVACMSNGRGFPTRGQVAAFIAMPCLKEGWQPGRDEAVQDKPIDWELVMHIASMNNGKGFPARWQVAAFLAMPCLKEGWHQGYDGAVQDKPIDRDLLMRIGSMNHRRGFPTREQVAAFVAMPCLKEGWHQGRDEAVRGKPIDRALLMYIASMNNGKGFPTKAQVEAFMAMPCLRQDWQGCDEAVQDQPVNRELVMHIACLNHHKGFPAEAHTRAFVRWLPQKNKICLRIASRVFRSSGLPEQRVLRANERTLRQYLSDLPEYAIDSDDDISDSENEPDHERAEDQRMKVLALFCSAPDKWRLNFSEFEQYVTDFTNDRNNDRTQVSRALASLLSILFYHGGAGVRFWLARHNQNQQDKRLLTKALSIPAPLDTVKFALTQLPESECLAYIVLCAKLTPALNKAQWDALKPLREQLDQCFVMARSKTMMLEILWSQPEAKRSGYGEKLDSFCDIVFDIVPTTHQLYRIHRAFGPQKMQGFLDACIALQATNAEPPKVKTQELLMEGLLLAHHYLNGYEQIPDLCFSSQEASTNGKGVMINGDAAMVGQKRLWHFITAMLIELEQAPEYQFEKQQLTVLSGSGSVVLPKPEFSLVGSGFVINNWSLEQVQAFFTATEFTERWYKKLRDPGEHCVTGLDERLAHIGVRASETEKTGNKKAANQETANHKTLNHKRMPPSVILSVIKFGLPLKTLVWTSLEHYAKNGQLTDKLCQALAPVIEQQAAIAPDSVKHAVRARLAEIDAKNMADQAIITQPSPLELILLPPVAGNSLHRPQVTLATAMAELDRLEVLDRFEVLGETELEILQPYRDHMMPIQLARVIDKMRHHVDVVTQLDWLTTYEKKRKDALGLNELISLSDDRSDWLADILVSFGDAPDEQVNDY